MQIAVAQLNLTVGALAQNAQRLLEVWHVAQRAGARITLSPELSLCGYVPQDLLLRRSFCDDCADTLKALAEEVNSGTLIVGFPEWDGGGRYNALALIRKRKVRQIYRKQILRAEEKRYFNKGRDNIVFEEGGTCFTLLCGEDVSHAASVRMAVEENAQCALVAGAHAYQMGDEIAQWQWYADRAQKIRLPILAALAVGGQDDKVYMGASPVVDDQGRLIQVLPAWNESVALVRMRQGKPEARSNFSEAPPEFHVYQALVLALRDYVRKNRFPGVVLGLSGGIDSALVLALAVDAIGADRVHAYRLPSPYTRKMSLKDAEKIAELTGVSLETIALKPLMKAMDRALLPVFEVPPNDLTAQNIQARLRAMLLMALSNQNHWLLLTTGNKSESAVGYSTLYGDMAGGFAPLKDLTKGWVYRLAHYRNSLGKVIPERVLTRAPSAELKPDQTDQDSLPPYEILDAIIEAYVERGEDADDLLEYGFTVKDINKTLDMLGSSEYKRSQSVIGPCVTARAFDGDWRYPLTSFWRDHIKNEERNQGE